MEYFTHRLDYFAVVRRTIEEQLHRAAVRTNPDDVDLDFV
jgi:hypothetical protein